MALPRDRSAGRACTPLAARRRGRALEAAIFEAAIDQLNTVGWPRLTMEGVAAAAQTGKAALYRRWARKEDLVVDALNNSVPHVAEPPDHGNVRDDLLDVLGRMRQTMLSPSGCALRALVSESNHDPDFRALIKERVLRPRKRVFHAVLRRAVERGEVRADATEGLVASVGPAMMLQQYMDSESELSQEFVRQLVDDVLMPLLRVR